MNRILAGAALAAALMGSAAAHAANTPSVDYAARCTSLADQWKTAETANATHASLGKAKADAAKGEKLCKSKKSADEKKGSSDYEQALKLLGVTPT
jgi:opacity protein-like surface antigen